MTAISGFLLDEDKALHTKLEGYETSTYSTGNPIPIAVYFRFPDAEEVTRTFPHIAIDLVDVRFEGSRAHRANGYVNRQTLPFNPATPSLITAVADDMPLPWSLIYQLATYSRAPREDRQLQALMYQLFPEEYGFLDMSTIDGTFRRADFISAERRDTVDNTQKRLYRNIYTVAISSEFSLSQITQIANILTINLDLQFTGSILVNS